MFYPRPREFSHATKLRIFLFFCALVGFSHILTKFLLKKLKRIAGVMENVLASSAVGRGYLLLLC
jgi:hypothetical protein